MNNVPAQYSIEDLNDCIREYFKLGFHPLSTFLSTHLTFEVTNQVSLLIQSENI